MPSLNSDKIVSHINDIKEDIIKCEMKRVLKEKYDIDFKKIEKSNQSTDGNVYIVYCKSEKYIIKIYKEIEHTESMVKLYSRLKLLDLNIPRIILSKSGKEYEKILNTNYLVIYSFLDGEQISWNSKTGKLDNDIIVSIAKELRKFHKGTEKNEFDLPKVPFKNNDKRQSALHFDLTRNNIFICNNNQIGFIDFDDAKYGDSVCDIAILIANLFFSKTRGVDIKGLQKFVDEYYYNEIALKDEEVPLIKEYALHWINYILDGNEFDTSTTESFEIRKKLISEKL